MRKFVVTSISAILASLVLVTACAKESSDKQTGDAAQAVTETTEAAPAAETVTGEESIMDQPVDFSSAENVEKTLQAIQQQAGEKEAGSIRNAIGYLIVYDLSVKRDKDKLYKKLDGQTPNQILALTRR